MSGPNNPQGNPTGGAPLSPFSSQPFPAPGAASNTGQINTDQARNTLLGKIYGALNTLATEGGFTTPLPLSPALGGTGLITGTVAVTTPLSKTTDAALAPIIGLSVVLAAGGTYRVHIHLPITSGASGGAQVALATSDTLTLTSSNITATFNLTATAPVIVTTTSGLATSLGSTSHVTDIVVDAVLVVNAAGTLICQGAQNASNGTATVFLINGYMDVIRIS